MSRKYQQIHWINTESTTYILIYDNAFRSIINKSMYRFSFLTLFCCCCIFFLNFISVFAIQILFSCYLPQKRTFFDQIFDGLAIFEHLMVSYVNCIWLWKEYTIRETMACKRTNMNNTTATTTEAPKKRAKERERERELWNHMVFVDHNLTI